MTLLICAFKQTCVLQFDIHSPGATVHEALLFSAQLRLIDTSKDKMRKFVDEARPCADTALVPYRPITKLALCNSLWGCP